MIMQRLISYLLFLSSKEKERTQRITLTIVTQNNQQLTTDIKLPKTEISITDKFKRKEKYAEADYYHRQNACF